MGSEPRESEREDHDLSDRAPESPPEARPLEGEATEPDLVFTDGAGGAPLSPAELAAAHPKPPAPAPLADPRARKSTWRRVVGRLRQELGDTAPSEPVATAPCPSCRKAVPRGYGNCPFCAGKMDALPTTAPLVTTPGSAMPTVMKVDRVQSPSFIPAALAPELAALKAEVDRVAAEATAHRKRRRRLLLRWAPVAIILPWTPALVLAPWYVGLLLLAVDVAVTVGLLKLAIRQGGEASTTIVLFMPWLWVKLIAGGFGLGRGFFVFAMFAAVFTLAWIGAVGVAIGLERGEIEHGD